MEDIGLLKANIYIDDVKKISESIIQTRVWKICKKEYTIRGY